MTFRAKPASKRPGRAGWDAGERRTTLINIGFAVAIVVSILILIGYAAWTWYDGHYGAAGAVDGAVITRDDLRNRQTIETFRIDYTEAEIRALQQAGHISADVMSQQIDLLTQRRNSLPAITLEKLIDVKLQATLAGQEGITVSEAEVDAQLTREATTDEQRHVWVIEVAPVADPATGVVGDKQIADARAKAYAALAGLRTGRTWEDVAKTVSTAASAPQAGDIGWLPKDSGYDAKLMEAAFAVAKDTPTDVIAGDDGTFRIGRVTEVAPAVIDTAFSAKLDAASIKMADYRVAVRADVTRKKLADKVVADLSGPSLQRHVLQIFLPTVTPSPDGVKVRHILFAPNNDAGAATTLPASDPGWATAQSEATAAYATLLRDPSQFDQMARTMSDENSAKQTGGKQPFYDQSSAVDSAFLTSILATGLKPGDILPPFKTAFGWHVVQFMRPYGDGNEAWLETIKKQADAGTDFSALARDQGEGDESRKGGDIGWVASGQLGDAKEGPIFDAAMGATTVVIDLPNDGDYLFKVLAEETRPATAAQIAIFNQTGFTNWYSVKKAAAKIDRNVSATSATG